MPTPGDAASLLTEPLGPGPALSVISVPGRVNLIGEHIDYHNLPVLPMAIQRCIHIAFRPRRDRYIRAISPPPYGEREFEWKPRLKPSQPGDWVNYLKAAAQSIDTRWSVDFGIDAAVTSDLPAAAGLSSSSALLAGFTLALLQANGINATLEELMDVLPEAEHFVGTRGGGMDHAAVLASKAGCALLVQFAPFSVSPVPIPKDWSFLVAHSLISAEKSGELRSEYNSRRSAGSRAIQRLGLASYAEAVDASKSISARHLEPEELRCFQHVVAEALRVRDAVAVLRSGDADAFGRILNASHASLRDQLRVSCAALDTLVEMARESGALGARLTGAGFGGCAVILCHASDRERVETELVRRYYSRFSEFDPAVHLIAAEPSAGVLGNS